MADRRILKSQAAIKEAFIELMSTGNFDSITVQEISDRANIGRRTFYYHYLDKYDLLSKLIEEHINELRKICSSSVYANADTSNFVWFDYFEHNYHFFSIMLKNNGLFAFRTLFLEFVIEELKNMIDISQGQNKGLSKNIYYRFFASAIVGVIESYFTEGVPESSKDLAEQVMILLERNI